MEQRDTVKELLEQRGQSYAEEAGITLGDKPSPLYRLLVLATLLSKPISSGVAVAAARELFKAGCRTPQRMLAASWQDRVDALGRGHYRRYDESTATILADSAQLCLDSWGGDLRRLHEEGGSDVRALKDLLTRFPGIGPTGADIFLREVQGVWPDIAPYADQKVLDGARRAHLPADPDELAGLVPAGELPVLMSALVRVGREH
ncbi:hypothetical protein [Actinoplanes sp. NPDC026619]|uniref:hypothetical protein n=1 Tax=Actinoplanes sp. NPDC026619 TaxID=3155798 RepID=UPI0033DC389A